MRQQIFPSALVLLAFLAGCVVQNSSEPFDCGVVYFHGELTDGLITPTSEMKKQFLPQLEERDRERPYC